MIDFKDFNVLENHVNFDFKSYLQKVLSYWKWFVLSILICLGFAYNTNVRKQNLYALESTIGIKEEDNPLFTSNTSLVFNWGGTSDKVSTVATTLLSRSHNEVVVDKLNFYIDYLQERKYFDESIYGNCPFEVLIDKDHLQIGNTPIEIKFVSSTDYLITLDFENTTISGYNYRNKTSENIIVNEGKFSKKYKIGQQVTLPFLSWKLVLKPTSLNYINQEYKVSFGDFNSIVSTYRTIKIDIDEKAASILKLSLQGTNKSKIVDYLNETVNVLIKTQLENKNLFAENTIRYIDTTLALMENKLNNANSDLKSFSKNKNIIEIENDGYTYQQKMVTLDVEKDVINRKIYYYNTLKDYLKNSKDYTKLPAPSVAGIDDPNIMSNVSKLISLSVRRSEMEFSVKSDVVFNEIDNEIAALKKILLENINASKSSIQFSYKQINDKIFAAESNLKQLPEDKQELVEIMRKYNLSDNLYQTYLQKRSEASIVKAANLSDIKFIDSAKDIGGGLIGQETNSNYVFAVLVGLFIPLLIILLLFLFNTSIQNSEDLSALTKVPLLGLVGVNQSPSSLAVFNKPKSPLSESFRGIRSSLQFLYKRQNILGSKVLMITSSIGGEGKTFCSINIATVFALSDKKTVIVGFDLRKPKLFNDFDLDNDIGVVNYLIGQKNLEEITNKTKIENLDLITSGPIPPNPSELILSESMKDLIEELKLKYDYIILDTPPIGLVTDAIELSSFTDVTIYVMRQNVTKKAMVGLLNNLVRREELKNVSIVLNGFENKAKYGTAYGYGYNYGYGYSEDGSEQNTNKTFVTKIKDFFKRNKK